MIESLVFIKRTDTKKREREDGDEIGNMTRSGRCFKPDNLRTDGDLVCGQGERKRQRERKREGKNGCFSQKGMGVIGHFTVLVGLREGLRIVEAAEQVAEGGCKGMGMKG